MPREADRALSSSLSRALIDLTREYARAGEGVEPEPDLVLWSSFLRLFGVDAPVIGRRELSTAACLSTRAMKSITKALERRGWVALEDERDERRGKAVRLSPEGSRVRDAWAPLLQKAEQQWARRLGRDRVAALRRSLERLVPLFAIDLPHYPLGYGPADPTMAGAAWPLVEPEPPRAGPPRLPAHANDWAPVVRTDADASTSLPLSALLSQTLVAFALDYEDHRQGPILLAATALAVIDDEGVPLARAPRSGRIAGNGKSTMERHNMVVVDPPGTPERMVRLTPHGRALRDAYPSLTEQVEARWRDEYGTTVVDDLRSALRDLDGRLDPGLPAFPDVRLEAGGRFTVA